MLVLHERTYLHERTPTVKQTAGPLMGHKEGKILWDVQERRRNFWGKFCRISIDKNSQFHGNFRGKFAVCFAMI